MDPAGFSFRPLLLLLLHVFFLLAHSLPFYHPIQRSDGLCAIFAFPNGYLCNEYMVHTKDGFLLGLQKLSSPKWRGQSKGPAFLNHGILIVTDFLMQCLNLLEEAGTSFLEFLYILVLLKLMQGGDFWLLNNPAESLGFIMADAGYDVWIANIRSSRFSHGHIKYDRNDKGFWDWSLDELALIDLPAMLQATYVMSGRRKIKYVGYSQGSQIAFAGFSKNGVAQMVDKAVMLAPVAYISHVNTVLSIGARVYIELLVQKLGVYEFSLKLNGRPFTDYICKLLHDPGMCVEDWLQLLTGPNCCLNMTRMQYYEKFEPQSSSTKNFAHFSQQFRDSSFSMFDYGIWGNMKRYGWIYPPAYDLNKFPSIPVLFFCGPKDALADPEDVQRLVSELPIKPHLFNIEAYAHLDFIMSPDAHLLVYSKLLAFLDS